MPPPRDVVVVLLDSLNRHLIGAYGGTEFDTPNLDRLAARSVRFTNHHTGSLPCMPARHDLLVGALDFPWRPWGSIEIWEDALTHGLRRDAGVSTMLVSDHPHLFETGGENYHTEFQGWEYVRGGEDDPWRTRADPSHVGAPTLPPVVPAPFERGYDRSRTWFRREEDFPGPRTMTAAASWLDGELGADRAPEERALLVVDEFDPHEPFDTPLRWAQRYDPGWEGERLIWPPYLPGADPADPEGALPAGTPDARAGRQLRAQYGAKLSMIDHWLGRILDVVDRHDAWGTTAVILCTDHGVYLGERDVWGKPSIAAYPEMSHIPLMVAWPGIAPGTCAALTTTVDLHATLCDAFGVEPEHRTHGRSLVPLLDGTTGSVRDWALCGVWGREVHVIDASRTFAKSPVEGNRPLSMFSNRWSTMPIHAFPDIRLPRPDGRAVLDRPPGSDVPVIRQPFDPSDHLPFWAMGRFRGDLLYEHFEADATGAVRNLVVDPGATAAGGEMTELLVEALRAVDAPAEQLTRLGVGG
ncbi:MAG: sulfatase [Acidimicrobiia bacterium]